MLTVPLVKTPVVKDAYTFMQLLAVKVKRSNHKVIEGRVCKGAICEGVPVLINGCVMGTARKGQPMMTLWMTDALSGQTIAWAATSDDLEVTQIDARCTLLAAKHQFPLKVFI
jgi:hypothetical protein